MFMQVMLSFKDATHAFRLDVSDLGINGASNCPQDVLYATYPPPNPPAPKPCTAGPDPNRGCPALEWYFNSPRVRGSAQQPLYGPVVGAGLDQGAHAQSPALSLSAATAGSHCLPVLSLRPWPAPPCCSCARTRPAASCSTRLHRLLLRQARHLLILSCSACRRLHRQLLWPPPPSAQRDDACSRTPAAAAAAPAAWCLPTRLRALWTPGQCQATPPTSRRRPFRMCSRSRLPCPALPLASSRACSTSSLPRLLLQGSQGEHFLPRIAPAYNAAKPCCMLALLPPPLHAMAACSKSWAGQGPAPREQQVGLQQ